MMSSGPNTNIQEALRRFLPHGNPAQSASQLPDPTIPIALAGKFASAFSKYSAGTRCTPNDETHKKAGDGQSSNMVTLAFKMKETGSNAWVELPVAFVKSLFASSLGGVPSSAVFQPKDPVTRSEQRFVAIIANDIAEALSPLSGYVTLARVFLPDEPELPGKPDGLETISLLVSTNGVDVEVQIDLPVSQTQSESLSANVPNLAGTAARVLVEPEIRLPLRAMALSEIAMLKQGDILSVAPEATGMSASLAVRGNPVMECELGQIGSRYSARIIGPLTTIPGQNLANFDTGGH